MSGATIHQLPTRPHRAKVVDFNPPHRPAAQPAATYPSGVRIAAADRLARFIGCPVEDAWGTVDFILGLCDEEAAKLAHPTGGAS